MKMFALITAIFMTFAGLHAHAVEFFDVNQLNLGAANKVNCVGGMTCTLVGNHVYMYGTSSGKAPKTIFSSGWTPGTLTGGTSTNGSATVLYMTQIYIDYGVTITGIAVNNAATVGTNKYIVALFNGSGVPVANSALAGVTTAGASSYQSIPFTSPYALTVPGTYWIGVYINGATDTFYTEPAVAQIGGLAGSVSGQVFGTVGSVTLPTTFTANVGPIAFTY